MQTPNQISAASAPTLNVTAATGIATSFSSTSELAINFWPNGQTLTLGGYNAAINSIDRSNANTPGVVDSTNTDTAPVPINTGITAMANTNDYAGNNIRAAISTNGGTIYTSGTAATVPKRPTA